MATIVTRAGKGSPLTHTEVDANFTNLNDEAATKAPLASPALTGTPTAPTASLGTNTTQVATTAFVIANAGSLDSPAFTGTPTAPTASVGTNTTQVATTAFVNAEIANDAPTKTGGGASGTWGIAISGNAATATSLSTDRTNWSSNGTIDDVVGQLAWKNYGNNHTIFDASQSTSPNGGGVNNTNAQIAWTGTYPTLMGWNGANTYGVRVDSARVADSVGSTPPNYSSGNFGTGANGTYTFNHGLGSVPSLCNILLYFTVTSAGWGAGNYVICDANNMFWDGANAGMSVIVNGSQITVKMGSDLRILSTAGARTSIPFGNFVLNARAWR